MLIMQLDTSKSNSKLPSYKDEESILIRGVVTVAFDPIIVFWNGQHVPLSRIEGEVYAHIFRRGRIHVSEIDSLLQNIQAKVETRSLVLGHIRGKFTKIGACNPFERIGKEIIRLRVDADAKGRIAPVIGVTGPRYVKVKFYGN